MPVEERPPLAPQSTPRFKIVIREEPDAARSSSGSPKSRAQPARLSSPTAASAQVQPTSFPAHQNAAADTDHERISSLVQHVESSAVGGDQESRQSSSSSWVNGSDCTDSDCGACLDVDAVAAEIGVNPTDLLRCLQENPQSVNDERKRHTMMKCAASSGKASVPPSFSNMHNADGDRSSHTADGRETQLIQSEDRPLRIPRLVSLEFGVGEDGKPEGAENEMTPTPQHTPNHDTPSQLVFRTSGSNFSALSGGGKSTRASDLTPRESSAAPKRKEITFASNVVTDVCVYEVDDELFVGVAYSRHWAGWVFLLLGLILEVTFDVHIGWFVYVKVPDAGYLAVQNWVCVLRAILSLFYIICCVLLGVGVAPNLQFSFSLKGFGVTTLMSFCLGGALALEVATSELASTPHFFTTSVLHCVWIVLYRVLTREMVFLAEVAGVLIAVIGFIVANIPVDTSISVYVDVVGNLLMLVSSLLYASYFLLQVWLRQRSPTAPMVFNIGLVAPIIGLILGASYGSAVDSSRTGMYGMFHQSNIVHSSIIAIEGLFCNVCFLGAIVYLDILSVSACYTLKSMFAPLVMHYLVWVPNSGKEPLSDRDQWSDWFYIGFSIVMVGSSIVIYFASVKRRFVARRVASSQRKRTPDPYRKRRMMGSSSSSAGGPQAGYTSTAPPLTFVEGAVSVDLTNEGAAAALMVSASTSHLAGSHYIPAGGGTLRDAPQRPSSPMRRASVESRNGRNIVTVQSKR